MLVFNSPSGRLRLFPRELCELLPHRSHPMMDTAHGEEARKGEKGASGKIQEG